MLPTRPPVIASTYTYPWDLADSGVGETLRRLSDDGFGAIELTTSYHPIQLHTPGAAPRRLMSMDLGGVFFPARADRYGVIKPRLSSEPEVLRAWPHAAEVASDLGVDLNAWTVALYQPWIAHEYPHTARVLPMGEVNRAGVCPSCPDVREFMAELVADLADQFPIRTVQLEGVNHPFFDTGWRLQRVLVGLSPWMRWLASLCFCESCQSAARERGVDVRGLRDRVCAELDAWYRHPEPEEPTDWPSSHEGWLAQDEDYAGFIEMRQAACVELVLGIAARLQQVRREARLGIWGPLEFDGTQIDLERVASVVGQLQTRQPLIAPDNAAAARRIADERGMRLSAVHWCGGRIGPPWGPDFSAAVAASVGAGVDQIVLFNWAMLRPAVASAIVPLLRDIEAEVGPRPLPSPS